MTPFVDPTSTWLDGIDLVAVERAVRGWGPRPELTDEEQRFAARVMEEAGLSKRVIAERLGVGERTLTRWRGTAPGATGNGGAP